MKKVFNFVKGKRDDKKDPNLSLNITNICVEITDPAGITTPSDDYALTSTTHQCNDYEVDLTGKDKTITKLHKAAWVGNLEKVKTHLKKIDVNVVDSMSRTPLHLAAAQGHINIVWFLLSHKARTDIYDFGKKTAFMKAVEGGYKEIVSNMLEKGADMNAQDAEGNTALHIATKMGYYEIASVLLKRGSNFECINKRGEFPLHIATTAEHMDLVELLLRYGAGVNVVDANARTPLMLAARCGNAPLVELFLEYGARRDMTDDTNLNARDYALNKEYKDLAALLVTASAGKPDEDEKTEDDASSTVSPQVMLKQQSGSSGSLVPADGSNQDLSDDVDSWNDTHTSSSHVKPEIPKSKIQQFFVSPSSSEQINEESSTTKEEKNVHDSPHSCIIPPPLKPPRSWDLIQAGMIDDNTGSEVKRCSLTVLGTLRSRRESFNDSNKSELETPASPRSPTEFKGIEKASFAMLALSDKEKQSPPQKKDKSDLSTVESDWDSDESLPLDKSVVGEPMCAVDLSHCVSVDVHHEPTDDDDLPAPPSPSQLTASHETAFLKVSTQPTPGSGVVSPEPVSEKRARMLLMQNQQSVELTLTDDHTEEKSDHSEGSPSALPKDVEEETTAEKPQSSADTLGRDGTMLGYEEMWESNAAYIPTSPSSTNPESAIQVNSYSLPRIEEKVETSDGEHSPSSRIVISLNLSKDIENLDETNLIRSPNDHSIDSIGKEVENLTKKVQDSKISGTRHHVRNKSISLIPPSESLEKRLDLDRMSSIESHLSNTVKEISNNCINRELECYDEAIRDLEASAPSKVAPLSMSINPITNKVLQSGVGSMVNNTYMQDSCKIMPDLLSDSKVASLSVKYDSSCEPTNSSEKNPKDLVGSINDNHSEDKNFQLEGTSLKSTNVEAEEKKSADQKKDPLEKQMKKKRTSLLALQKFEPTSTQGSGDGNTELTSSDSEEEPAFWSSLGINKVHRQPTVIMKNEDGSVVVPSSLISPVSVSLSEDVQIDQLSAGSSSEDATAPLEDVIGSTPPLADFNLGENAPGLTKSDVTAGYKSQPEEKTINQYSKDCEEYLLKQHLQEVTEEHGRLAETTVELGERTERLLYELEDAREAARARDEVIALLQIQLQQLEESHCKGLEEAQTHRFHLDSRDQELRHLDDVCRKAEEEKNNLKEIIRLKDKEIVNLSQVQASKQEEMQRRLFAREREKDITISELRIHLKYLEEEKTKLKEALNTADQQAINLQSRNESLLEEKARTLIQTSADVHSAHEETSKWRNLYESSIMKLEAVDQTQLKLLLDSKSHDGKVLESFHSEIRCVFDRLDKEKEADREIWQAKIKEEVSNAVQLLKSEYEKVEQALRSHNQTLEALVEKLQKDLKAASEKQETVELQLKSCLEELHHTRKEASEVHTLQLELSQKRHQSSADSNQIKVLLSECETKDQALNDIRKTLEIMRQEKATISALYCQQKTGKMLSQAVHESFAESKCEDSSQNIRQERDCIANEQYESNLLLKTLKEENAYLKSHAEKLSKEIYHLKNELKKSGDELAMEKQRISSLCSEFDTVKQGILTKATSQLENTLRQQKEDLERQVAELKIRLQKRDSSPSSANLSNASAMTDQVRWNQSGLMGVVQKQKEEIENLKAECSSLKAQMRSIKSPIKLLPEVKQRSTMPPEKRNSQACTSQNAIDLLQTVKKIGADTSSSEGTVSVVSICEKCGERSASIHLLKKHCAGTQTIEGCESPAHTSKCSSPRHYWSKKSEANIEQELQAQAERCLKHQQMIAGLKSELQLLRGGNGDYQINLQKQVSDLQQKIKDEVSLRSTLEMQMNKMKYAVQEKGQMEKELEKLKGRLDKEFVSRHELDHIKLRTKLDSESTLHSELSTKLAQVNKLLLQQAHERNSGQFKEASEALIRKEYEDTRQYLVTELAKVQASLQAKEEKEKELKLKCEKLSRECDKKNEQRRKILIDKFHNLEQQSMKESHPKIPKLLPSCTVPVGKEESASSSPPEHVFSQLLRKEVKRSAERFKTADPLPDMTASGKSEEYLRKKYCLP